MHFRRRGVGPEIALDEEHETEILHGGEVNAFVGHAGGLPPIADPGERCDITSLQACAERDPGEHRDEIAKHRNGRDHVALFDVAEVRGAVAAFRRRIGFRHVLHHGVRGAETANQQRSLVADHGREPVVLIERVCRGAGAGFLAESEIDSADDFALLVKILQRHFHFAVEQHVAIDLDALLLVEIFRVPDGRDGCVEISSNFVADVLGAVFVFFHELLHRKIRMLQAVVRDGVGANGGILRSRVAGLRLRRSIARAIPIRTRLGDWIAFS